MFMGHFSSWRMCARNTFIATLTGTYVVCKHRGNAQIAKMQSRDPTWVREHLLSSLRLVFLSTKIVCANGYTYSHAQQVAVRAPSVWPTVLGPAFIPQSYNHHHQRNGFRDCGKDWGRYLCHNFNGSISSKREHRHNRSQLTEQRSSVWVHGTHVHKGYVCYFKVWALLRNFRWGQS